MSSVDTTATNATNVVDFPNTPVSLKNNNFIAKDIRAFIDANIHLFREERLHIGGALIVIYTVLNGQREPPGLASIAAKIYTKVYGFRSSSAKPVPLVCYLFLLDYPKRLDVSKSDITSEECNSGSTTFNLREKGEKGEKGYKFTEVVVWRQEEWEKVFYHELIHAFHIDTFVLPPQPKMDAKLHKRLAFYNDTIQEAYAEVLATVLALACGDKKVTDWKDDIIFMGSQVNKIIYFYHSVHNGHEDKLKELAKNKTPPKPLSATTIENESMVWAFFSQQQGGHKQPPLPQCNFASYYILKSIYFWASLADPALIQVSNLLDPDFINTYFYATLLKSLKSGDYMRWLVRIYFTPTTDSLRMTLTL